MIGPQDRWLKLLLVGAAALIVAGCAAGALGRHVARQRWPLAQVSIQWMESLGPLLLDGVQPKDPWGRRYVETSAGVVYSRGPNGRDEGGAGDDLVVVQTLQTFPSRPPRSLDEFLIAGVRDLPEAALFASSALFGGLAAAAAMRAGVRWTPGRRLARLRVVFGLPFALLAGLHAWRLAQGAAADGVLTLPAHMKLLDPTAACALNGAGVALAAFFALLCLVERLVDRAQGEEPLELP